MTGTDEAVELRAPESGQLRASAVAWIERMPRWLRWALVALGLLVLSTALVSRIAVERPALSRIDEYVYLDSVDKATRGEITRQGSLIDEYAMDLLACRGVELLGTVDQPCGGPYDVSVFPYRGGVTSADIHSPVYFFATAWMAQAIQAVTGIDDLLLAARLTGAFWLAAGLTALTGLTRALGPGRLAAGAVTLLVLAAPSIRWTNAYVTPDALNLLVGSLIMLGALKYARGQWAPWFLIAVSGLAALIKAQNSIGSALAALFLVLVAATMREGRTRARFWRFLGTGLATVAVALATQHTYGVLRARWSLATPPAMASSDFNLTDMLWYSGRLLLGNYQGPDATFLEALAVTRVSVLSTTGAVVLVAGLTAAALFASDLSPIRQRFAQATALACLTALPLFYLMVFSMTGRVFPLPERYGAVMLPAMAAACALMLQRRATAWAVAGLGLAGYVAALVTVALV